ncbi:wall-associated protein [Bacillus sp. V3-13]|uniref:DNRLRE domain-containing protein n=1 Tax=Bacillus sp. V3-13 TaxID=2053728 RepID=UPI000C773482|nr:DNRLRE domain-containing protein [Bacillus sp. V3-13]PLR76189.1 wall-associated protein [Bacillus sp. V3-13]
MGKRRFARQRKVICWLAIIILLFGIVPPKGKDVVQAAQTSSAGQAKQDDETIKAPPFVPPANSEQPPVISNNLPSPPIKPKKKASKPVEIVEERTETEKIFKNGDGTFTKKIYMEPVHVQENKKWEEISSELMETTSKTLITKKTKLKSNFKKDIKNGEAYATFEAKGHSIEFALKQAKGDKGQIEASKAKAAYKENTIKYKDIFPGIDLRSTTFNKTVKEDIVLHQFTGQHQFVFELKTDLQPSMKDDGAITFQDASEQVVFVLPKPYMSDSNINPESAEAVTSQDVTFALDQKGNNVYELTLTADPNWLQAPERVYPVYIDPSLTIDYFDDAFVASRYPTTNYSGGNLWNPGLNAYVLKVGYYDGTTGTNEAFIKQEISGLQNTYASIYSAKFYAYAVHHYYVNSPNGVWLDQVTSNWYPASLNWNNRPGSFNVTSTNVGRGQWAVFNVTGPVQSWANGSTSNYGFKLHTAGNGQAYWKKFIASENGTNAPYLEINYSYPTPAKPRVNAYSNGTGSNSGYLDVSWDPMPGATGYEVLIFNGYDYVYIPVGNVTNWSTKGKNIWPTPSQVASGEFNLHLDGRGAELALDPSPVYRNAFLAGSPYGDYSSAHGYWIRIMANYPYADSPISAENIPYIPLEQVNRPVGSAYTNVTGNSGYVTVKWDPVPGATGYKIWIYNGRDYEPFDVGNVTTWTTQNQNIWPTDTEIAQGRYLLHHDKGGTELSLDPSPVYRNSGGVYGSWTNYWFRVTAYSTTGYPESSISQEFTPRFTTTSLLGIQDYWTNIPVIGGSVTAFNGNFVMDETDFQLEGRGPGISITRTYNSQDSGNGLFGNGWYSSIEERIKEEANGNILLTEEDKGTILFTKTGDNQYQPPNGVYLEIKKTSTGFEIKDKDQSVTVFSTEGKKQHEKDEYGNQVTYTYDSTGKLTTIKDASGREFLLTYTGEHVTKITGPENRTVTYEYSGDNLIASTTPRGKKYRYGYENGNLRYIYDPKHTDTEPYKTTYTYENNKLVKITDPLGKETSLTYNDGTREVTVTDPKNVMDVYGYTIAGNPLKTVVDADALKLTTTYEYQTNNLTKKTDPKDQGQRVSESYTYDAKGNVTTATDAIGTEKYEYNQNNDVTKVTDAEQKTTSLTYNGANPVSETEYQGRTSSVTGYDQFGNPNAGSDALAPAANLLRNAGFESALNSTWLISRFNENGNITLDSNERMVQMGGSSSLLMTPQPVSAEWGYVSAIQVIPVEPNKMYTLSGWIKLNNVTNANVFFNIEMLNEQGIPIANPWRDNRYAQMTGTHDWTKRQLTFTTSSETRKVRVYLEMDHSGTGIGGKAWFDNVQLEEGPVSSSYNPVANSSFEYVSNGKLENWTSVCNPPTDPLGDGFAGYSSLEMERKSTADPSCHYRQELILNQTKPQDITVTAMSKAEKVTHTTGKPNIGYSFWVHVYYANGVEADYNAVFPIGTKEWNRSAIVIPTSTHGAIRRLDIHPVFNGDNIGKVWFDDFRAIEGSILTKNEYDNGGNYVTASYDEENRKTSFSYDIYGNKNTETDPKNNTKSYEYNLDNQLTKTTLPNGTSVAYKYDDNGNTTEKLVSSGTKVQTVTYEYDADNKLTVFQDALLRKILHTYDANANRISTKMPNGSLLEWTYDAANRVTEAKRNGTVAFSYQYDANGNETKVTDSVNTITRDKAYDAGNRITSMTDRGGSIAWSYHPNSHKLKETKTTHGTYTNTTTYDYDALNQNTKVVDADKSYYFEYDEFGNVGRYQSGNDTAALFTYDKTQKITDLFIGTKNATQILSEKYTYDANGNRTSIDRKTGLHHGKTAYAYDEVNQLTKETLPDGTVNEFTYDGFSNRTSVKVTKPDSTVSTTTATFNSGNLLTSFGNEAITYDLNGNRLSDGQFTYQWNEADHLISVTQRGQTTPLAMYKYDDDGRRIEKNVNGQITRYHYDGDSINVLYETDGNGAVLRQYVYNADGVRLAMKSQGQTLYYHYNPHGDVIAITDQGGQTLAQYAYDAWGNILQQTEQGLTVDNPFKYAGYMYDEEISMYYLMARYYHPKHGVFISVDPDPGDEDDPITQNGYAYTNNNPVMMNDPDGHVAWWVAGALGGAAWDVGSYLWKNRNKGYTWKGVGKSALRGAVTGVALGGVGKIGATVFSKAGYKLVGYSKNNGRIFALVNKNMKPNKSRDSRLFALDYHKIRENKLRTTKKILHVHWKYQKNKHYFVYPPRKKTKWTN